MSGLKRLLAHLRWADERALEALRAAPAPPAAALEIYAHVLGAEHVWLARLRGEPPRVAIWPELTLEECAELAQTNQEGYHSFTAALPEDGSLGEVTYRNSTGQEFRSSVEDILLQVVTHGSYHRGQVALLLRQAGAEPLPTDYIAFVRGAPAPRM